MPSSLNKSIKSKIKITQISAKETYPIRLAVLRKGLTLNDCIFDGDNKKDTFHLGLFFNNTLIGVATYMAINSELLHEEKQVQLRGMAILDEYQGMSLGKQLLNKGELLCKEKHLKTIWFNARETAVNFYNKNNYKTTGDYFNIEGVGKHIVMFKDLHITDNKI